MNARDLIVKFASYAHYLASREWAREGAKPPWLLCVAPELAQERRMQRVEQASLLSITELVLWTTTSEWLCEHGPLASIWSLVSPLGQATTALHRRGVFERSLFSSPFTTNQDEPHGGGKCLETSTDVAFKPAHLPRMLNIHDPFSENVAKVGGSR